MAVLGIILIIVAVAVGGAGVWIASSQGAQSSTVDMFGNTLSVTPLTMLILGALAVFLLLLGIWFMTSAGKRSYRSHRERRDLEKRQRAQEKELEETRARLAKEEDRAGKTDTAVHGDAGRRHDRHAERPAGRERHAERPVERERHAERPVERERHAEREGFVDRDRDRPAGREGFVDRDRPTGPREDGTYR